MEITAFTDGSCIRKNNNVIYCGYGIYFPNNEIKNVGRKFKYNPLTNQRAELYAIYKCLKLINKTKKYKKVTLYSDSLYSIKCLTEWYVKWEKNNWMRNRREQVKNFDIIMKILKLKKKFDIKFVHVRSHTNKKDFNSLGNNIADTLAKKKYKL